MSEQLLPCPFCGETPDVDNPATFRHEEGDRWACVVCCIDGPEIRAGIYTPLEEWKDEAIAEWNKRAPTMPPQVRSVLAACVREVIDMEGATPALEVARAWLAEQGRNGQPIAPQGES